MLQFLERRYYTRTAQKEEGIGEGGKEEKEGEGVGCWEVKIVA